MNSQIKNKAVYWGTGRRKTSVARVRLIPGNGQIKINGRSGDDYLNFNPLHINAVKAPLQTLGLETSYDIFVNVGLFFPLKTVAISVASLPSVLSFASTKNQLLSIVSKDGVIVLFI